LFGVQDRSLGRFDGENGQMKVTLIGNETMENPNNSGQLEGGIEILDKLAAVVAGLKQAK
jgi:hypothetical protein